jgi:PEP-CTERM motif-containing protein
MEDQVMKLLTHPPFLTLPDVCNSPGGNMKRLLWLTPILFALLATSALADSVSIFYSPNDGSGGNFGFLVTAPGLSVSGGGGTPFDFFGCCNPPGYLPGSTLGGFTDIFFDEGFATIGGISYDVSFTGGLFMSTIVLPTNGKDYNAPVEISFGASGTANDPLQTFISVSGSQRGYIYFSYSTETGGYFPGSFAPVPEPGTLGLTGTGMIGLLALVRNRLRGARPWPHRESAPRS